MTTVFGIPMAVILGQLMLGLVNGSFYAMLSLGLAVIFGLLRVVNFAHGAFYTLGAFAALLGLQLLGINYWASLILAPLVVGILVTLVASLRPALRATRVPPIAAVQEGAVLPPSRFARFGPVVALARGQRWAGLLDGLGRIAQCASGVCRRRRRESDVRHQESEVRSV